MRRHLFYIVLFSLLAANSFAGTWTVINTNDANAGAVNSGDLRWCINQALGAGVGPHTINFAIVPAAATYQININSMLPAMYSGGTITIDATTQSGWAGTPIVIIRGNSTGFEAIQLGTGTYTVKGLIFQNLQRGITVYDGSNHLIQNCWFGLSSAGTSKVGNALTGDGIYITKGPGTKIGGTGTNQGNVISGACDSNGDCGGIRIDPNFNSGTSNILIQGNYIGTDYTGNNALAGAGIQTAGNSSGQVQNQAGIYIQQTQNDPITIDRNVVSNNLGVGIDLNNQSNKITVIGNMIGTNTTGMQPLGNYCVGMRVRTNFNTVIGGATAAERNIISANGIHIASIADATSGATNFDHFNFCGIFFQNAQWAQVMGNYIGTDATGNATSLTMGNFYGGVKFLAYGSAGEQTANITLGGNTTAHGNVIGGNGVRGAAYDPVSHKGHGVLLQAGGNTSFNVTHDIGIYNNYIGISPSGANIGNQQDGISFYDHVDHITIGGAGLRNYIANNSFGVFIQNNCQNNTIAGNYIGTTINGMGAAPNLSGGICIQWNSTANTIGTAAAGNVISGHNGNPGISFKDAGSGLGTGDNNFVYNNYIGLASDGVTQLPNGIGILIQGGSKGNTIGGTGANQRNYISGNSPGNAIEMENADNNIISGNYIGLDKNGTVPGAVPNAISNNLHGIVMTAGYTPAAANGSKSRSSSDGNTISNNVISNNVLRGLSMDSSNNNTIQSNIIGLNPAGTASMSNGSHGIFLSNGSGNHFVSNVISSNKEMGIYFFSKAINNFIESNMIGTDITGTIALGNNFNGILITGSSTGNTIGGNSASKRNYICANGVVANSYNNAISIETNSHLNVVEYNFLGVSKNNMPMGNASHGISVDINSDDVSIIRNVISANKIHGIIVQGGSPNFSDRAVIQGNYIGTDSAGLQTVPVASIASSTFGNGIVGVIIKESTGSQFGGSGANQGNIVANSKAEAGLLIVASTGTKVFGNKIGVNKNNVDAGNFTNGITLRSEGITPTSNNIIGGVNAGESNTIWNNKVNGIEIDGSSPGALSNSIHKNSISCNLNRGIVLTSNGNNSYPKPV
ncbi:MAG: beta strand repeat-containing protein, partial [Cytophagaceae bacterium]